MSEVTRIVRCLCSSGQGKSHSSDSIQSLIWLLQQAGLSTGYHFKYLCQNPYSKSLEDDLNEPILACDKLTPAEVKRILNGYTDIAQKLVDSEENSIRAAVALCTGRILGLTNSVIEREILLQLGRKNVTQGKKLTKALLSARTAHS